MIYLDYNASTPVDPVVAAAMRPFLDVLLLNAVLLAALLFGLAWSALDVSWVRLDCRVQSGVQG